MKRLLLLLAALIMILSASVAFAEEDPDAVIREWEEKYGDQRLWDYLINAAFAEQESWRYAWNPSVRPMLPDQDAISAEEAENLAIQFIPQYGSEINAERLESLTCVVSSYRKPENDMYDLHRCPYRYSQCFVASIRNTLRRHPGQCGSDNRDRRLNAIT